MDGRDDALDLKLQALYYTIASSELVYQLKSIKAFYGKILNICRHFFYIKLKITTTNSRKNLLEALEFYLP